MRKYTLHIGPNRVALTENRLQKVRSLDYNNDPIVFDRYGTGWYADSYPFLLLNIKGDSDVQR